MQPLHTPPAAGTAKAGCLRLRQPPRDKLKLCWPPEQIAGWLAVSYPDDPKMRVRHETVYLSLFVRSGALRKELTRYLRSGRAGTDRGLPAMNGQATPLGSFPPASRSALQWH